MFFWWVSCLSSSAALFRVMSSMPLFTCFTKPSLNASAVPLNWFLNPSVAAFTAPVKSPARTCLTTSANVFMGLVSQFMMAFPSPITVALRPFMRPPIFFNAGKVFSNHPTRSSQCVTSVATSPMMRPIPIDARAILRTPALTAAAF